MGKHRDMIAVCQMTSGEDVNENVKTVSEMIRRAAQRGCKMAFFPECFDYVAADKNKTISSAESDDGPLMTKIAAEAKEHKIWLSLGGLHEAVPGTNVLPKNAHIIINDNGEIVSKYRKLHLFDLEIPGKVRLMESKFSSAGRNLVPPVETPIGKMGLAICYDLRFPELSLWYRNQGAQILTYPAAFTVPTGYAHWQQLLTARAIETQSYVIAAAQTGKHNDKRSSYGHSMVIDPWGAVIAQCSDHVDMCFAEINLDYLEEVRLTQPVFVHRRNDLYSLHTNYEEKLDQSDQSFGSHLIDRRTVFYQTPLSFAFVNLKPVVPGHCLIASKRRANRLTDLSDAETADLFVVAKKVQAMLERTYSAGSSTVCVQDGPNAGQTVKHCHVHILPRKDGDFEKDAVYHELERHDKDNRLPRTLEAMIQEAALYRSLFNSA